MYKLEWKHESGAAAACEAWKMQSNGIKNMLPLK